MTEHVSGYVVPLTELRRGDVDLAGGKGAQLGELIRAGAPVPAGVVLTTAAYEAHLHHSGLAGRLADLCAAAPDGSAVRAALRAAAAPSSVVAELREAYAHLVGDPTQGAVAVRSSATAEDLPEATFAGQQETYLNVVGEPALIDAVRDCWASLWSERAIAYRERRGISAARMAVVVQRMVPAEVAGVMFTADPVNGARDVVVIDANPGLGEAVVAGLVTPDHAVLDKSSGRVRSRTPGRREVVVRPRPGGGTETVPGPVEAALGKAQLRRLARLGARVERHFGAPQDIEWAWYRGRPYLLQSRPATALPAPPAPPPLWAYSRAVAALIAEVVPVRPYPLDVTTWLAALFDAAGGPSRRLGLRISSLREFVVTEDEVVVRLNPPTVHPTWRALLLPVRLRQWSRTGLATGPWAELDAHLRDLRERDLGAATWPELLATVRAACVVPAAVIDLRLRHLPDAVSMLWLWLTLSLLGRADQIGTLMSGTDHKTAETGRALDALAARVRADPPLAEVFATGDPARLLPVLADRHPEFLAALRDFLDRYGHRETASPLLATQPTWRDEPEVVLGLLQARAATPPEPGPARPRWQVARDELLRHPLLRLPPVRRAVLRWLAAGRRVFRTREDSRFYLTLALPVLRACMLELGRRLATAGVLAEPEGVFHLTLAELESVAWPPSPATVADLRARVERRAAARAALAGTPLIHPSRYAPRRARPALPGRLLRGRPGSPGVVVGPARIVRDATEFDRLHPGEVLVTPYTNPAWTPLFPHAAAVVVDTGGVMSHAAIIAREYGIPAVMATGDGTRRLSDGERVRVDGTHGLVERL